MQDKCCSQRKSRKMCQTIAAKNHLLLSPAVTFALGVALGLVGMVAVQVFGSVHSECFFKISESSTFLIIPVI